MQLTLFATDLPNVAGRFKGTSDPFAIITVLPDGYESGNKGETLGVTETVKNDLNPTWTKCFNIHYEMGKLKLINIGIFDEVKKATSNTPMGSAAFEIGDILGAKGNIRAKRLRQGGILYAKVRNAPRNDGDLYIQLRGFKLKNVDPGFFSTGKSDPYFEISRLEESDSTGWTPVARSKRIPHTLNPRWKPTEIALDRLCDNDRNRAVRITVLDHERNGKHQFIGSVEATVNTLLAAVTFANDAQKDVDMTSALELKDGNGRFAGSLVVTDAFVNGDDPGSSTRIDGLRLQMSARGLKNVDKGVLGMGKSDPFYVISSRHGNKWGKVMASEHISNNLNPRWNSSRVRLDKLCNHNREAPIQIEVFDYEKDGRHKLIGRAETSVQVLLILAGATNRLNDESRGIDLVGVTGKVNGKLMIDDAEISVGGVSLNAGMEDIERSLRNLMPGEKKSIPSNQATRSRRPSFVEYISGGCQVNLCVAIDFSSANGNPRDEGTLHYVHSDGSYNDYETAIASVGSIIAKYDSDNEFPVWGFSARHNGEMQNCFQVGEEAIGLKGVIRSYRSVFNTDLAMSGPTVIHEVIKVAASQAKTAQKIAEKEEGQAYTILLILTCGHIHEMEETKKALIAASLSPLSVVIVGIGDAEFRAMQFLDDLNVKPPARDITQFVEFQKHKHSKHSLASATLEEIPDQLVDYFHGKGIPPLSVSSTKFSDVKPQEYNKEQDYDLMYDMADDGSMTLSLLT